MYQGGRSTIISHGLRRLYEEVVNPKNMQRKIYALLLTNGIDDSLSINLKKDKILMFLQLGLVQTEMRQTWIK